MVSTDSDDGGLLLQLSLGEAVANYMVARMIDGQETLMQEQQKETRKMQEKQLEALKDAADKLQAPPLPEPAASK